MRSSLKEALERRGQDRNEASDRRPSGIPIDLVLRAPGAIEKPVSLVRALVTFGLELRDAHDVVDRLAARASVAVTLILTPESESFFSLQKLGVTADAPVRDATSPTGATAIPGDVLSAIDAWRLSRPERPTRDEAIRIILRRGLATA